MRFLQGIIFCFIFLASTAQQNGKQVFKIVEIPSQVTNNHPGIKGILNRLLAKANSTQEAFTIINNQLKTYKNSPVRIRQQLTDNTFNYLVYFIGAPKENHTDIVDIKGTRDIIDESIFKKYQLRVLFSDTIVVIDTLKIAIYPSDFNYKISGYFITIDNKDEGKKVLLQSDSRNILLLCQPDFNGIPDQPVRCMLFNDVEPNKEIAEFYLRFIDNNDLEELHHIAETLYEDTNSNPEFSEVDLVRHLKEYAKTRWGNMQANNISNWLRKAFRQ